MDVERKIELAKQSLRSLFTHDDHPAEGIHAAWEHLVAWSKDELAAMQKRRADAIAAADAKAKAAAEAQTITSADVGTVSPPAPSNGSEGP